MGVYPPISMFAPDPPVSDETREHIAAAEPGEMVQVTRQEFDALRREVMELRRATGDDQMARALTEEAKNRSAC